MKKRPSDAAGSAPGTRIGNRERILAASLELFNEQGTHAVSTNHIAAHLSISPGNLYYHFANREEIIRAIFPQAAEGARNALPVAPGRPVSAADVGAYLLAGIETLWRFRFFYRDVDELLARDPLLAAWFRDLQDWLSGQFEILFERLIEQGDMRRPDSPGDLRRVAVNSFILWTNWLRYVTVSRATLDLRYADIVEGALHGFLAFAPYLKRSFAQQIRQTFEEQSRHISGRDLAVKVGRSRMAGHRREVQ